MRRKPNLTRGARPPTHHQTADARREALGDGSSAATVLTECERDQQGLVRCPFVSAVQTFRLVKADSSSAALIALSARGFRSRAPASDECLPARPIRMKFLPVLPSVPFRGRSAQFVFRNPVRSLLARQMGRNDPKLLGSSVDGWLDPRDAIVFSGASAPAGFGSDLRANLGAHWFRRGAPLSLVTAGRPAP